MVRSASPPAPASTLPPFAVRRQPTSWSAAREALILLVVAAGVAFFVKAVVAQAFFIPSPSMVPQLEVHDRVVVSKLAYHLHDPRRGDIIVFDAPPGEETAPPRHDALPIRLVRDLGEGIGLIEPSRTEFIKRVIALPGETVEGRGGHVYVNGKRLFEPYLPSGVDTNDFSPHIVPPHTLWVMGDNRGDSIDSRRFGPIRRSTVVGRTVVRIWPVTRAAFL